MKNLDPKTMSIPRSGWSPEDRAREVLDLFNQSTPDKDWEYSKLVIRRYPQLGTDSFAEGFFLACAWLAGSISGGRLRDGVKAYPDLDPMMFQRFIEHAESHQMEPNE